MLLTFETNSVNKSNYTIGGKYNPLDSNL